MHCAARSEFGRPQAGHAIGMSVGYRRAYETKEDTLLLVILAQRLPGDTPGRGEPGTRSEAPNDPNENLRLGHFFDGIVTIAALLTL
jgi:hypothetical protein